MQFGSGCSRRLPRAGRVVLMAVALVAAAGSNSHLAAQVATGIATVAGRQQRPFDHRRHERVSCVSCHGTGAEHRTILIKTARDCASCHHDPAKALSCSTCHGTTLLNAKPISSTLRFSVWDSARARVLNFSHDRHTGLNCRDCHGTPATLARNRDCSSCHEQHHQPQATCGSCHVQAAAAVHKASVHLTCSGAGCHAPEVAPPPTLSRTLCLACHPAQTAHEPGRTCRDCHRMNNTGAGAGIGIRGSLKP